MPNHFHGIITIGKNRYNRRDDGGGDCGGGIIDKEETNQKLKPKIRSGLF